VQGAQHCLVLCLRAWLLVRAGGFVGGFIEFRLWFDGFALCDGFLA
jgi:hypothetical protein